MLRAATFRRVSTEQQARQYSLAAQEDINQRTIQERRWSFVKDYNFEATHGPDLLKSPLYVDLEETMVRWRHGAYYAYCNP